VRTGNTPKPPVSEAKRLRRRKAKAARKLKEREEKDLRKSTDKSESSSDDGSELPLPDFDDDDESVDNDGLVASAPVTGISGGKIEVDCEDCSELAIGIKHGRWPKCWEHMPHYGLDLFEDMTRARFLETAQKLADYGEEVRFMW